MDGRARLPRFARIAARGDDPVRAVRRAEGLHAPHLLPASLRREERLARDGVARRGFRCARFRFVEPSEPADASDAAGRSAAASAPRASNERDGAGEPPARRPLFDAPAERDDLKRISGIGPVMERHLNELGVVSFAQLAAFDEADVARVDAALTEFRGRIVRDDWVGQARVIVAERKGGGTA